MHYAMHCVIQVQIQALAFSCHGSYLASIGGADDNNLVCFI